MLHAPDPLAGMLAILLALALAALALVGALCYRLLVERGRLLLSEPDEEPAAWPLAAPGLAAGSYLSDFALPTLGEAEGYGKLVTLSGLAGQPLLLVVLHPDCLYSRAFARELAAMPPKPGAPLVVAIVAGEEDRDAFTPFAALPGVVLHDPAAQSLRLTLTTATPVGYLVDRQRRTVGAMLRGPKALLSAARGIAPPESDAAPVALTAIEPPPLAVTPLGPGDAAPAFTLPILDGGDWSLAEQRGTTITLLFSDPTCPPCIDLLEQMGNAPGQNLVIVSRGDRAENEALIAATGVDAPVLLQRRREVARLFGALETPAAYIIDEGGRIAAGPMVGIEAILALPGNHGARERVISRSEV